MRNDLTRLGKGLFFALCLVFLMVPATFAQGGTIHVVRRGDTLSKIAQQYGTSWRAIMQVNGLQNTVIYPGQRLTVPQGTAPSSAQVGACSVAGARGERWIDVNISTQRIYACEGQTSVYAAVVSTGRAEYPTVTGTYAIWVKLRYDDMQGGSRARGDYYYLEDVPYTMYFYRGYGIHGTYWHDNFGTPMSHGCVNLTIADAQWFFTWAEVGTKVVTHY